MLAPFSLFLLFPYLKRRLAFQTWTGHAGCRLHRQWWLYWTAWGRRDRPTQTSCRAKLFFFVFVVVAVAVDTFLCSAFFFSLLVDMGVRTASLCWKAAASPRQALVSSSSRHPTTSSSTVPFLGEIVGNEEGNE